MKNIKIERGPWRNPWAVKRATRRGELKALCEANGLHVDFGETEWDNCIKIYKGSELRLLFSDNSVVITVYPQGDAIIDFPLRDDIKINVLDLSRAYLADEIKKLILRWREEERKDQG